MKYLSNILVSGFGKGYILHQELIEKYNFDSNILVCNIFTPELYIYLNKCKGIIIEHGGKLCHAAIVAREANIPCVRIENATKLFKNGQKIEIKENGEVVILD
jgi:pyruvate,water dikinase